MTFRLKNGERSFAVRAAVVSTAFGLCSRLVRQCGAVAPWGAVSASRRVDERKEAAQRLAAACAPDSLCWFACQPPISREPATTT